MHEAPTPVLMFSSLTYEGARVTLDALEAGAVDFLPKNFEDIARDSSRMQEVLKERILAVAASGKKQGYSANRSDANNSTILTPKEESSPAASSIASLSSKNSRVLRPRPPSNERVKSESTSRPRRESADASSPISEEKIPHKVSLVAIGTSTGGPIALQKILTQIPGNFSKPIILVQHMPASFTPAFAERLNKQCQITVKQAEDGDLLKPGVALLAPGGKQMIIESRSGSARIKILEGDERLHYKPSVDLTFGSAARSFPGKTLGIILTGMGADGKDGCRLMKQAGSTVWTQDEKSCVIYGMPMSVVKAGFSDEVLSLSDIAARIVAGVK